MNRKLIGIAIVVVGFISLLFVAYLTFFSGKNNQEKVAPPEAIQSGMEIKDAKDTGSDRNPNYDPNNNSTTVNQRRDEWVDGKKASSTTASSTPKIVESNQQIEDLKAMAMAFAERYGSYSNHSNYENIRILMPFMTDRMKAEQEAYMRDNALASTTIQEYNGTTVAALTVSAESVDEAKGSAVVKVGVVTKRSIGTFSNSETFNQEATLTLARERNAWKVDSLVWR